MAFYRRYYSTRSPTVQQGDQVSEPLTRSRASSPVNFDIAMSVSYWWACVKLLAETVASMPLKCYEKKNGIDQENTTYPLYRLFQYGPSRYLTRLEFFEVLMLNLVSDGNAYFERFDSDTTGRPFALVPRMSGQIRARLIDGELFYLWQDPQGNIKVFPPAKIWHIKLFGNGITGLSPLAYASQTIDTAVNNRDRASTIAKSGGKQNGILMYDKALTKEQRSKVRENFNDLVEGGSEQLFVLDKHYKFERTSLSPQDMQLIESTRMSGRDICRFLGVPSILVNDAEATTAWGSGIKEIVEGFYKFGTRPYLERIEASMTQWLIPINERERFRLEFDFDSLLRSDFASRFEAYQKGVNSGVLTPNEARREENLPPLPGGDKLYLNGTLTPAGVMPMRAAE